MLTVGETYFFRNQNHFKALSQYIFPRLSQLTHKIYILSAGCSSGEEPYSIVMLCKEEFPDLQFELIAIDINHHNFVTAKKGLYSQRSIKQRECYE